ncbi:hypothetical protein CAQUA_05670 [Corynebacterium aquatimens]|nr:hypothetical protein CAQUA_05670 [Corynebacterium aquatimens]
MWAIAAMILAVLELAVGEFTLLMLASAAFITAGVTWAGGGLHPGIEVAVFGLSSAAMLFFVRPYLHRHFHKPAALDTSTKALVGTRAIVLEDITPTGGQIKLDGSIWSARALDPGQVIREGEFVTVSDIDGPTAVVWQD